MSVWKGGLWGSQRFPNGGGLWRGGLWASERLASIWTPAALFSAGQQGVWLDTLPQYLYEDSAGTIEDVVHGDPVGRADERSGNANNLTQATSADRPIYNTDGSLHWLGFDGAGDALSAGFSMPHQKTVIIAVDLVSGTIVDGDGDSTARSLVNGGSIYAGAQLVYSAPILGKNIVTAIFDGVNSSVRINGALDVTGDAGTQSMSGLAIGRDFNGTPYFDGAIFGLIIVEGVLPPETIDKAESYFANLIGVTL